jgi:hypothetical protein
MNMLFAQQKGRGNIPRPHFYDVAQKGSSDFEQKSSFFAHQMYTILRGQKTEIVNKKTNRKGENRRFSPL